MKIAIIGTGGHSKVIVDLISHYENYKIIGFYDDNKSGKFLEYPILGKINDINNIEFYYIIAIGDDLIRKSIYNKFKNLKWITLIHPSAIISKNCNIDIGTIVMAGAIIQAYVKIGKFCIINTGSSIDHECEVGDFSSICPNATLCGNVSIGYESFIGANATIIQKIKIGNNCIIGAGSVVIRDVDNNSKLVGNPAKIIKY
jgi:acetyltransferase EpsM